MHFQWISEKLGFGKDTKSAINFIICFILILVFFYIRYGLQILNPVETAWLMKFDWAQHYMGWYFFRNDPWSFPLGGIQSLFYPSGTNVGFTDSIPLVAILLKPFSGILPEQFQYFGFWLFLCHVLTAYFSIKFLSQLKINGWLQLLAVVLITFNPVLIYRAMHSALSAHWLVVANFWVYFLDPATTSKKRILIYQLVLLVVGGLINPYFAFINGAFLFILTIKLWYFNKVMNLWRAAGYVLSSLFILVGFWIVTGYFNLSSASHLGVSDAYGLFSWNLSSFFNPFIFDRFYDFHTNNTSSFLPAYEMVSWEQYESYSYLGLGVLILTLVVLILSLTLKEGRKTIITYFSQPSVFLLIGISVFFILFAISNRVTFNQSVLFSFSLPSFTKLFTDIFRASARYIWVIYYLWFFVLVFVLSRVVKNNTYITGILAVMVIIQLIDIRPLIFAPKLTYGPYQPKINEALWTKLYASTDKILFLPPLGTSYVTPDDWQYFSFLAAKNRKPISVGHIARIDFVASRNFHQKMLDDITQMNLDTTAIYVMHPAFYSQFLTNYYNKKADVIMLDGYFVVCPLPHKYEGIQQVVQEIKNSTDQSYIQHHFPSATPNQYFGTVENDNPKIKLGIYEVSQGVSSYVVRGWGFHNDNKKIASNNAKILIKDFNGAAFYTSATMFSTPDVAEFFQNPNLANVGYAGAIETSGLPNGKYQIGIEINQSSDDGSNETENQWLDNYVFINNPVDAIDVNAWKGISDKIRFDFNVLKVTDKDVEIEGWAFAEQKIKNPIVYISVENDSRLLGFQTTPVKRPDVAAFFNSPDLENSGFIVKFSKSQFSAGIHKIGLIVKSSVQSEFYQLQTDKVLEIKLVDQSSEALSKSKPEITTLPFPQPEEIEFTQEVNNQIKGFLDIISDEKYFVKLEGWGFIEGLDYEKSKSSIILKSGNKSYKIPSKKRSRADVKAAFNHSYKTDSCGFEIGLRKEFFDKGQYEVYLLIEDINGDKQYYFKLNGTISI